MPPALTGNYQGYSRDADFKLFGKSRVADTLRGQLADLAHLLFCQFRCSPTSIISIVAATLGIHIARVVALCPSKEMVGIAAKAVVTLVQGVHSLGKSAIVKFVAKAMGIDNFVVNVQNAIAVASRACPFPAIGECTWRDMLPKTLFRREAFGLGVMSSKKSVSYRLTASTFAKFWGVLLGIHRCNFSTFYTYLHWQMADNCQY